MKKYQSLTKHIPYAKNINENDRYKNNEEIHELGRLKHKLGIIENLKNVSEMKHIYHIDMKQSTKANLW